MKKEILSAYTAIIKAGPLKERIKMIITGLICITIIVLMITIRIKNNTIQTLQDMLDTTPNPIDTEEVVSDISGIDTALIVGELKSAAELSSAELSYTGLVHYTDGNVPFFTKKAFYMIYHADIRAGIDFKKFREDSVTITEETVTVILPKVEIFEINIIEDKIIFVDEKKAMFNTESKDDVTEAIKAAKTDLDLNLDAKALMAKAAAEANKFIEKFLRPHIGNRTLEIKYQ